MKEYKIKMYVKYCIPVVENIKIRFFVIDKHLITPPELTLSKKVFAYQITLFLYQGDPIKYVLIPNNQYTQKELREVELWAEKEGLNILSKQSIIETENPITKECQEDIRDMFGITIIQGV